MEVEGEASDRLVGTVRVLGSWKCLRERPPPSAAVELEPAQRSLDQLVSREAVPPSVLPVYPRRLGAC